MSEHILITTAPFRGANFIKCCGSITKSIDRLRKGGATEIGVMGTYEDGTAWYNFDFPDGKPLPHLNCLDKNCCVVKRRGE